MTDMTTMRTGLSTPWLSIVAMQRKMAENAKKTRRQNPITRVMSIHNPSPPTTISKNDWPVPISRRNIDGILVPKSSISSHSADVSDVNREIRSVKIGVMAKLVTALETDTKASMNLDSPSARNPIKI